MVFNSIEIYPSYSKVKDLGEMTELDISYLLKNSHNSAKTLGYIISTGGYTIL